MSNFRGKYIEMKAELASHRSNFAGEANFDNGSHVGNFSRGGHTRGGINESDFDNSGFAPALGNFSRAGMKRDNIADNQDFKRASDSFATGSIVRGNRGLLRGNYAGSLEASPNGNQKGTRGRKPSNNLSLDVTDYAGFVDIPSSNVSRGNFRDRGITTSRGAPNRGVMASSRGRFNENDISSTDYSTSSNMRGRGEHHGRGAAIIREDINPNYNLSVNYSAPLITRGHGEARGRGASVRGGLNIDDNATILSSGYSNIRGRGNHHVKAENVEDEVKVHENLHAPAPEVSPEVNNNSQGFNNSGAFISNDDLLNFAEIFAKFCRSVTEMNDFIQKKRLI